MRISDWSSDVCSSDLPSTEPATTCRHNADRSSQKHDTHAPAGRPSQTCDSVAPSTEPATTCRHNADRSSQEHDTHAPAGQPSQTCDSVSPGRRRKLAGTLGTLRRRVFDGRAAPTNLRHSVDRMTTEARRNADT